MNNILMIAFHYPPVQGSSGIHRTLAFSRYLPEYGFKPIILTVSERAYLRTDNSLKSLIPPEVIVSRAKCFDVSKDFPIKNYYPLFLSLPDRWQSWVASGVIRGLGLIRQYRPKLIWSTYPIASAHLIALILHKLTKIPWIADFRDPMAQLNYPSNKLVWHSYKWIEKMTVKNAAISVFTTPGAKKLYCDRYGKKYNNRFKVIENGIDEGLFDELSTSVTGYKTPAKPYKFLHSGLLYQEERNPEHFFKAVYKLKKNAVVSTENLQIILRASGNEIEYQRMLEELQISDVIELAPPVSYREALAEMVTADVLLLFQGASCNYQIPAKVYEYLRTGIPIIGLVDGKGDTCQVLKNAGHFYTADLDSTEQIEHCLLTIISDLDNQCIPDSGFITNQYDRKDRTKSLAEILKNMDRK